MTKYARVILLLVTIVLVTAVAYWFYLTIEAASVPEGPVTITYDDLVVPLTDASGLHRSLPGVRKLYTSYDRTGGNNDYAHFIEKTPEGRLVVADLQGPGVVHRFWFTGYGKARNFWFYFDGEEEPRMVLQPPDVSGDNPPFSIPIAEELSGAHYSYTPIPFQKRLRIVSDAKDTDRSYFQFTYTKYPEGSTVPQFRPNDKELLDAVARIKVAWEQNGFAVPDAAQSMSDVLNPGATAALFEDKRAGLIRSFWLKLDFPAQPRVTDRNAAMRELVLKIYWTGSKEPSVNVPVGDFFCNAWRKRQFKNAPLEFMGGRYVSRFPMAYEKGARIEIVNEGSTLVNVTAGFDRVDLKEDEPVAYFHANWVFTDPGMRPHPVLSTSGKGHFLGCFLTVTGQDGSWMILEGDDQIWLDGESVPSMHGTGLEDYFNGGWYYNNLFARPFHGLLERTPFRTSQYRFHGPDPVDFKRSIRMVFEKGDQNDAAGYMTSAAYWYQDEPTAVPELPSVAVRLSDRDPFKVHTFMAGSFELERLSRYGEAVDWCTEFVEANPQTLEAVIARLRSVAYAERIYGFEAVKSSYEQFARHSNERVAGEAGLLLKYGMDEDLALFGIHTAGSSELYLDGKLLGRGKGPLEMQVFPAKLLPGEHIIAAKVPYERHESWFAMYLRSHRTNLYTDVSWKVTYDPGDGWETAGHDDRAWGNATLKGRIPFLGMFYFIPNAFIDMQSPWNNIRPGDWNGAKRTAYFRKKILIPDSE